MLILSIAIGVAYGYTPENGACRDNQGKFGARYENGDASFLECKQACDKLGEPCQAFDTDAHESAHENGSNGWCGLWGVTFIRVNTPAGFSYACESDTKADTCNHTLPVTHGDPAQSHGNGNVCYLRYLLPTPPIPPSPAPTPRKPDGRSSLTFSAFPEPAIVPWPKSIFTDNQYLDLYNTSYALCIQFSDPAMQSPGVGTLAAILQEELVAITSGGLNPQVQASGVACPTGTSTVIDLSIDSTLAGDASRFTVGRAHSRAYSRAASRDAPSEAASGTDEAASSGTGLVEISAATYSALVGATAMLLQSIEYSSDDNGRTGSDRICEPLRWRLPFVSVPASAAASAAATAAATGAAASAAAAAATGAATGAAASAATGAATADVLQESEEAAVFNRGEWAPSAVIDPDPCKY
jgi:hypothetical protein